MSPVLSPTVVYVAGSGRSGSTLVERILGSMPGWVNVGELIDLFRRVYRGDERCGCGLNFARCEFWQGVGARAFGGWTTELVDELERLQGQVARQRRIPRLLSPVQSSGFRQARARYGELHSRLYAAIAEEAQADVVVDASKWPAQALALSSAEIDLRVLHVKREAAGVVHSLGKTNVVRPQATGHVEHMYSQGVVKSSAAWATCQAEVELLRVANLPIGRIDYERFVDQPRDEIESALRAIGLALPTPGSEHFRNDSVDLGASHGLSGNPGRFIAGTTRFRKDDAWRTHLTRPQRLIISAFALPDRVFSPRRSRSTSAEH